MWLATWRSRSLNRSQKKKPAEEPQLELDVEPEVEAASKAAYRLSYAAGSTSVLDDNELLAARARTAAARKQVIWPSSCFGRVTSS